MYVDSYSCVRWRTEMIGQGCSFAFSSQNAHELTSTEVEISSSSFALQSTRLVDKSDVIALSQRRNNWN